MPRFNEAGAITPRKGRAAKPRVSTMARFNEAGAITPRKASATTRRFTRSSGFNEAGAITPRKVWTGLPPPQRRASFNEAGAITPRKAVFCSCVSAKANFARRRGPPSSPGAISPEPFTQQIHDVKQHKLINKLANFKRSPRRARRRSGRIASAATVREWRGVGKAADHITVARRSMPAKALPMLSTARATLSAGPTSMIRT